MIFKMEDLRFSYHFLSTAYSPLPFQGDQDAAALSHGVCSLDASQPWSPPRYADQPMGARLLDQCCAGAGSLPSGPLRRRLAIQTLLHRVQTIKSLNETLGKPCLSVAEGDARFGAIPALIFQASCMADGMIEYLFMNWGCRIITETAMPNMDGSVF
ncbi:hypothetical protein B0T19DRAFT_95571 [Cercophora scortea]|uniref:Uncharacterized protein n=1 Tax=Cercophora scortea TaxID=314031 RepID=A0AAE0MGV6_9PEZI|nr:hypothetical protein B0T19DRAFT_95571 [Cercophora scortea]